MDEVILGMPGPWAEDYREKSDHYTTKIGGLPDWPVLDFGIGLDLVNCGLCGESLCLIAQVYAPIITSKLNIEERVIYVFGCWTPKCGRNPRSWRAIRVQKCHYEKNIASKNMVTMGLEEDFAPISKSENGRQEDLLSSGESGNESDEDIDLEELGRALSEAGIQASQSRKQNMSAPSKSSQNASEPMSVANSKKPVVPCFYIYSQKVQAPSEVNVVSSSCSALSTEVNGISLKDSDGEEKWDKEDYEYDRTLHADRAYLKFKKQLDSCPEQCFRYSFGGKPLLATSDVVEADSCMLCGSSRQYEMQFMSPLLYFLHEAAKGSSTNIPDEWSWMTLLLYTCSSSCCPSSCRQESGSCDWAVVEEAIIFQDD